MVLSPEQIEALLNPPPVSQDPHVTGFNQAAVFLLSMKPENLYDPVAGSNWWFRCKGCGAVSKRTERESHWKQHRKDFKLGESNADLHGV